MADAFTNIYCLWLIFDCFSVSITPHMHKKPSSVPSKSMLILGRIYFNMRFDVFNRTRDAWVP